MKKGLNYIGTKDIYYNNKIDYLNGILIPFKKNQRIQNCKRIYFSIMY